MGTPADVLAIAVREVGTRESPRNSNKQKYGAAFGLNGVPWCAEFVWWCFQQAGVPLPKKTAGVYDLMNAFKKIGRFYSSPEVGDIVIYSYGQGHTGILESFDKTSITVIEGNTSATGSQDNGGQVLRKKRSRTYKVLGFCRPAYSSAPNTPQEGDEMDPQFRVAAATTNEGGVWIVTRDGGVRAEKGAPFFGSYPGLPPEARQGDRYFIDIERRGPRTDDGYRLIASDGGTYDFFKK